MPKSENNLCRFFSVNQSGDDLFLFLKVSQVTSPQYRLDYCSAITLFLLKSQKKLLMHNTACHASERVNQVEYSGLVFLGLCWLPVFPVCDKGLWHFGCNIKITSCVYTRVCLFVFNIIWHLNFASFGGVLYMFLMTHKLEDHCFYQSRADTD